MEQRDTPIPIWEQHFSPRQIAEYFHGDGRVVGQKYKTYGELWSASDDRRQVGLLHLILEELRKDSDDWIYRHREWLRHWQPRIVDLLKKLDFHINRINKMIGVPVKSADMHPFWIDLPYFADTYRRDAERHERYWKMLESQVERLVSVKKPEHIGKLVGVGRVKAAKILEQRVRLAVGGSNA